MGDEDTYLKCVTDGSGNDTLSKYVDGVLIESTTVNTNTLYKGLLLAAGIIGKAPIKFLSGPLLTTPEAGAMEFDGTGIYLTPTNHRKFISLASDSLIATVTATTVASTTLWTGVCNANELKPYRVLVLKACGLYTTDATDTASFIVALGGTTIGSLTTPVGAITNGVWYLEIFLTIRTIGETGTVSSFGRIDASTGSNFRASESFAIDTTVINNITLAVTWSDTGNSLKITQCWLAEAD